MGWSSMSWIARIRAPRMPGSRGVHAGRRAHAIKDAPGRRCELKALAFASRDVRGGGLKTLAENSARYFGLVSVAGRPAMSHASSPPRHQEYSGTRERQAVARLRASHKTACQE
jgi:hypothetical protein